MVPARVVEGLHDRIWPGLCFRSTAGSVRNFFEPSAYGPRRLPALSTANRDGRAGNIMSRAAMPTLGQAYAGASPHERLR